MLQLEAVGAGLTDCSADLVFGDGHVRFGDVPRRLFRVNGNLIRLPIEFDEDVTLANSVVVVNFHSDDLPGYAGGNEGNVAVHVGVVGRNGGKCVIDEG